MLAAYFCFASLSLYALAFLLYLQDRHSPEMRFVAVITYVLGAVSFAFALLLFMEMRPTAKAGFTAHAPSHAEAQRRAQGEGQ